jgi:hypothetical protein
VEVDFLCRVTGEINLHGTIELVDFECLVDRVARRICAVSVSALAADDDQRRRSCISKSELIIEAPRSGLPSLAPVSPKELKNARFKTFFELFC